MNALKPVISILFVMLFLFSCGNERGNGKPATPKAFTETYSGGSWSRSGSEDLVEALFEEISDSVPALKKLKADLKTYRELREKTEDEFRVYNSKSSNYYSSAEKHIECMKDSLLKHNMHAVIEKSKQLYKRKTAELEWLQKQIADNDARIEDNFTILKINKTLSLMEKYQAANLPDAAKFKELIEKQNTLIQRLNNMVKE